MRQGCLLRWKNKVGHLLLQLQLPMEDKDETKSRGSSQIMKW